MYRLITSRIRYYSLPVELRFNGYTEYRRSSPKNAYTAPPLAPSERKTHTTLTLFNINKKSTFMTADNTRIIMRRQNNAIRVSDLKHKSDKNIHILITLKTSTIRYNSIQLDMIVYKINQYYMINNQ